MSRATIILGIFMFAVVVAVLTVWGMRKAYFRQETLQKMLLSKSADKVMRYLKTHDTVTIPQITELTEGIKAQEYGSRYRAVVQKDKAFAEQLVQVMLHDGLIEPAEKNRRIYKRKAKK